MQLGEQWNGLMTDCMVLQSCLEVTQNYALTMPGGNSSTFIWAGTYLDSVDDADVLAQLPGSIKVDVWWPDGVFISSQRVKWWFL